MSRGYWACICGISFAAALWAQSPPGRTVKIRFPDDSKRPAAADFSFRKPDGTYLQEGSSGGDVFGSLTIPRPTDGPTDGLKVRVWTPGCEMKMFDIPLPDADVEVPFVCDSAKTVTFKGQVVSPTKYPSISAQYRGRCLMDARGTSQCVLPIFAATANLEGDGSFVMDLPDFKADPLVSSDPSALFRFLVKTPQGWLFVKPEGSKDPSITVSSTYAEDARFVPAK